MQGDVEGRKEEILDSGLRIRVYTSLCGPRPNTYAEVTQSLYKAWEWLKHATSLWYCHGRFLEHLALGTVHRAALHTAPGWAHLHRPSLPILLRELKTTASHSHSCSANRK